MSYSTAEDGTNGFHKLHELQIDGTISYEEEYRRKKLISHFMELQSNEDPEDVIAQLSDCVRNLLNSCSNIFSKAFPCLDGIVRD